MTLRIRSILICIWIYLLILLPRIFLLAFLYHSLYFLTIFENHYSYFRYFIFYVTIYPLLFKFTLSCTFHEPLNILIYDSNFLSLLVLFQSSILLPLHSCVPVYIFFSADYNFYLLWLIIVNYLLWGVHGFELYLEHIWILLSNILIRWHIFLKPMFTNWKFKIICNLFINA